jgi:heat shock protein 4
VTASPSGGVLVHVRYGGEEKAFTPEQIMAMIIVDLKRIAEKEGGAPVVDCSLSVPVFYTEPERRAMLTATQARGGGGGSAHGRGGGGSAHGRGVGDAGASREGGG